MTVHQHIKKEDNWLKKTYRNVLPRKRPVVAGVCGEKERERKQLPEGSIKHIWIPLDPTLAHI